jgi:hypothetical protein
MCSKRWRGVRSLRKCRGLSPVALRRFHVCDPLDFTGRSDSKERGVTGGSVTADNLIRGPKVRITTLRLNCAISTEIKTNLWNSFQTLGSALNNIQRHA